LIKRCTFLLPIVEFTFRQWMKEAMSPKSIDGEGEDNRKELREILMNKDPRLRERMVAYLD
jgi:hypothetical protein